MKRELVPTVSVEITATASTPIATVTPALPALVPEVVRAYPGPPEIGRIDLRLGNGHLVIRGPFPLDGGEAWTVNAPTARPRHIRPKPGDNPEWLREIGRYQTGVEALAVAAQELGLQIGAGKRRRRRRLKGGTR